MTRKAGFAAVKITVSREKYPLCTSVKRPNRARSAATREVRVVDTVTANCKKFARLICHGPVSSSARSTPQICHFVACEWTLRRLFGTPVHSRQTIYMYMGKILSV